MTLFKLYDANDELVGVNSKQFNHKRFSMRAAAEQRHLDSLWSPGIIRAELFHNENSLPIKFTFTNNGTSQHVWE